MIKNSSLFLTLRTFSATGGIEKVCRIFGKALFELGMQYPAQIEICSMYDSPQDAEENAYFPAEYFKGYSIKKMRFIKEMVQKGRAYDCVILSHINLLPIGWLLKKWHPHKKIILLAHGIEIWYPLPERKKNMLHVCDRIFAVSRYTAEKISETHGVPAQKIAVLNNCLDPYLQPATRARKDATRMQEYGFAPTDKILMTLTRISSKERYKGYEQVIAALALLPADIKYLIAGSYDETEKKFLDAQIESLGLQGRVVMPGFIPDDELETHFGLADLYVMPSRKEGFGIVFIEAMHYGLPVVAGNIDGSSDALLHGRLGTLVDPENISEIKTAIQNNLATSKNGFTQHELLEEHFSYSAYKRNLLELLREEIKKN